MQQAGRSGGNTTPMELHTNGLLHRGNTQVEAHAFGLGSGFTDMKTKVGANAFLPRAQARCLQYLFFCGMGFVSMLGSALFIPHLNKMCNNFGLIILGINIVAAFCYFAMIVVTVSTLTSLWMHEKKVQEKMLETLDEMIRMARLCDWTFTLPWFVVAVFFSLKIDVFQSSLGILTFIVAICLMLANVVDEQTSDRGLSEQGPTPSNVSERISTMTKFYEVTLAVVSLGYLALAIITHTTCGNKAATEGMYTPGPSYPEYSLCRDRTTTGIAQHTLDWTFILFFYAPFVVYLLAKLFDKGLIPFIDHQKPNKLQASMTAVGLYTLGDVWCKVMFVYYAAYWREERVFHEFPITANTTPGVLG